jgi:hypothetical protein
MVGAKAKRPVERRDNTKVEHHPVVYPFTKERLHLMRNKNGILLLKSTDRCFSNKSNSNITKPSKGSTIGQNLTASLARVKRVPTAGGSGLIEKR